MSGGNKYLAEKKHTKIKNAITKKLKKTAISNKLYQTIVCGGHMTNVWRK